MAKCAECGAEVQSAPREVIVIRKRIFIGLILLFAIPVIGWIACGAVALTAKNRNIRNFARAMLIVIVATVVLGGAAYYIIDHFIVDIKWVIGHLVDLARNFTNYY